MLISDSYREQNRRLHASNEHYGVSGSKWRERVRALSDWGRKPVLDYGAGKATLAASLGPAYRVTNYDPCVAGMEALPHSHAIVFCGDVLEHVEPDCLEAVLRRLARVTGERALLVVHLGPALKYLPDGRNAHLIQEAAGWWSKTIAAQGLCIVESGASPHEAWFVVRPEGV